jgi:hypothetical protein
LTTDSTYAGVTDVRDVLFKVRDIVTSIEQKAAREDTDLARNLSSIDDARRKLQALVDEAQAGLNALQEPSIAEMTPEASVVGELAAGQAGNVEQLLDTAREILNTMQDSGLAQERAQMNAIRHEMTGIEKGVGKSASACDALTILASVHAPGWVSPSIVQNIPTAVQDAIKQLKRIAQKLHDGLPAQRAKTQLLSSELNEILQKATDVLQKKWKLSYSFGPPPLPRESSLGRSHRTISMGDLETSLTVSKGILERIMAVTGDHTTARWSWLIEKGAMFVAGWLVAMSAVRAAQGRPNTLVYLAFAGFFFLLAVILWWQDSFRRLRMFHISLDTIAQGLRTDMALLDAVSAASYREHYTEFLRISSSATGMLGLWDDDARKLHSEKYGEFLKVVGQTKSMLVANESRAKSAHAVRMNALGDELTKRISAVRVSVQQMENDDWMNPWSAPWNSSFWDALVLQQDVFPAVRAGKLSVDLSRIRQQLKCNISDLFVPAFLPFAPGKSVLFKVSGGRKGHAFDAARAMVVRLLASVPPGKLVFTLIDPQGLGQNVAALMHLADYDESLVTSRAWTESRHIEERLAELTEHMENVIQKYLRQEYKSIEDYNEKAGKIAEPYRVLLVMDFPVNFTDAAARRLVSIVENGARCGVYAVIVADTEKKLPHGFSLSELERNAIVFNFDQNWPAWHDNELEFAHLDFDQAPSEQTTMKIISAVGPAFKEAKKVEVPFEELLQLSGLDEPNWWMGSTATGMKVPLGPATARKPQYLVFGKVDGDGSESEAHALLVGRTGSGKSNLLHVIISTLALKYSPFELRMYLVDFKQGVEFKPYAQYQLPHASVIAIESEREFGISVLQGLDAEMRRRGEMFRGTGANITEYREKTGTIIPRILLLVDEFQEFFSKNDSIAVEATEILERLARQGRSNGIHMILSSQTLTGTSELRSAIRNQMAIRVALQCTEADSREILAHDNPAARLLSRPGEAIYNSKNGLIEGNNLFQVALFSDKDRVRCLGDLTRLAGRDGCSFERPIVFEGHEPAAFAECKALIASSAGGRWLAEKRSVEAWLGEPVAIRPPVAGRFRRQSGSHLLIIERDEKEGIGMLTTAVLSIAAQLPPASAKFFVLNYSTAESEWNEIPDQLADELPHSVEMLGRRDLPGFLEGQIETINRRIDTNRGEKPSIFIVIQALHRVRDLRIEESSSYRRSEEKRLSPQEMFATVLRDGPEAGIHVLAWCDTCASMNRILDRKSASEFSMRVAGPMTAEDSNRLVYDTSAAHLDKPHRAVFFDEERPGRVERFRPYAIPDLAWIQTFARGIRARIEPEPKEV